MIDVRELAIADCLVHPLLGIVSHQPDIRGAINYELIPVRDIEYKFYPNIPVSELEWASQEQTRKYWDTIHKKIKNKETEENSCPLCKSFYNWEPTNENIESLPDPIKNYIKSLQRNLSELGDFIKMQSKINSGQYDITHQINNKIDNNFTILKTKIEMLERNINIKLKKF